MTPKKAIIVFIKNPILGKVKTRLAKTVGDVKALEIYKDLLNHTRQQIELLPDDIHCLLFYTWFIDEQDEWQGKRFDKQLQPEGNLGQKMKAAFQIAFDKGYTQVSIIGSDCWTLKSNHIIEAFLKLNAYDIVIGPAEDGGYYLLAMNADLKTYLFENKSWSTEKLLKESTDEIKKNEHSFHLLESLNDIDEWDDYAKEVLKQPGLDYKDVSS